jgi:hypothetical protein
MAGAMQVQMANALGVLRPADGENRVEYFHSMEIELPGILIWDSRCKAKRKYPDRVTRA